MKILLSTVLLATVGLTGCVVAPIDDPYQPYGYTTTSSNINISNGNSVLQYTYGNGYYYDNNYDYYDGSRGAYVGGVWYVYRNDGSRYRAPPPRYKNPRYTDHRWPGYQNNNSWVYKPQVNNNYYHSPNNNYSNRKPNWNNRNNYPNNYDNRNPNFGSSINNSTTNPSRPFNNRPDIKPNRPGGDFGSPFRNNRN